MMDAVMASPDASTIRAERDFLASIVESSHDAVIGKTLEGLVTSWNRAAEEMFGYAADEMIGRPVLILFPPELAHEEGDILERLRRGERIARYETVRVRKDGRRVDVSLTVSPVHDQAGRVVGASKIVQDITDQKALQRRLAELQSELLHVSRLNDMGQLATAFAHELNQPLSAIIAYIGGARRLIEAGDAARAIEGCNQAVAQVARAGEVIRRLRDFVRKSDDRRAEEDLGVVIDEAIALIKVDVRFAPVEMTASLADDARVAFVDRIQVQQVLVNLLRNAIEATSSSAVRSISVSARRRSDQMVEVEVADSGPGVAEDVLPRLFRPFTTTKATGMGVGLSLCRGIVEGQGGEISARNRPEGGATFAFTLPVAASS